MPQSLGEVDPNARRAKLRDVVPFSAKILEQRTRKFLTLSPEFKPHPGGIPAAFRAPNREPVFPRWVTSRPQVRPLPFESGDNVLPGMELFLVLLGKESK